MKEIVIISGKGGTGKTSLTGSFAHLASSKVMADCDVDAANLHLLLKPHIESETPFISGVKARVLEDRCSGCGTCAKLCRFDAIRLQGTAGIKPSACEGCGVCAHFCPEQAIILDDNHCGTIYLSSTEYGSFIHARLFAGEENSGKLVSRVRQLAREKATRENAGLVLIDGAPGIGCPVIASITNSTALVMVTEPTRSGLHDLQRVLDLADHFRLPSFVCLNKWDLHGETAEQIEAYCQRRGTVMLGRIPFDPAVVTSQLAGIPLAQHSDSPAAHAMRTIWERLTTIMANL